MRKRKKGDLFIREGYKVVLDAEDEVVERGSFWQVVKYDPDD